MHHSHGIGYAEYSLKHEKRLDVEMSLEEDYIIKVSKIYAEIERRMKK